MRIHLDLLRSWFRTRSKTRGFRASSVTCLVFCHEYRDYLKFLAARISEVSDEVIFAVDDRVSLQHLRQLRRLNVRIILHKFEESIENSFSIYREATSEFVVRFDADELPSDLLLAEISNLREHGSDCSGFLIPRAWVVGKGESFINSYPWYPDMQSRVVRTNARLRKYPLKIHEPILPEGRICSFTGVIYHFDLVLRTVGERKEKVERYRNISEPLLEDGREVSSTYYLPELAQGVQYSFFETDERRYVQRALKSRPFNKVVSFCKGLVHPLGKLSQIEHHDKERMHPKTFANFKFDAVVTWVNTISNNENFHVLVTVQNCSDFSWPIHEGGFGVAVGARRKQESGDVVDVARGTFSQVVEPGRSSSAVLVIPRGAEQLGVIEIGVVDESREWLDSSMMDLRI